MILQRNGSGQGQTTHSGADSTTRQAGCRQLTSYSFRYRYAKGMHTSNAPIANISEAMGRTIEVHLKSYARFKPNATAIIIAAVSVSLPDPSDRGNCSRINT